MIPFKVVIPARFASTRLPGKPMADIGGKPMIVRVAEAAKRSGASEIIVACDQQDIRAAVMQHGFTAVMTHADHPSGTDRIVEVVEHMKWSDDEIVVNVQGDEPLIPPALIDAVAVALEKDPGAAIATASHAIHTAADAFNPNVVKVVGSPISATRLRALYFTRATAPHGKGPLYHHIGLYAYRRAALEKFVSLGPSVLEKRESLEQLRALEAQMRIDVEIVDSVPLGVDTPADLEKARRMLAGKNT